MAPMMLDNPSPELAPSKLAYICSDPSVIPSKTASKRIQELWWLHGHPHSKRYSDPKLVSLAALVRHNGALYKGERAFLYPSSVEATTPYAPMTWDEFDRLTEALALSYAEQFKRELEVANVSREQPTVGLLGRGTTIEYFCTELALQKLGVRVLLLAESNAPNALHHLLENCQALAVITDTKNAGVDTNGVRKLPMVESLPQKSTTQYSEVDAVKFQDFGDVWERHSFIIHSSGSTGMPKPIIHTNRSMMLIARMYRLFQEFSVENWFLLFPLYHIAGISIALSNLPNGQILSFPPLAWPPSSSTIFKAWKTLSDMGHPVDNTHCAPTLIENMYEYLSEQGDFTPLVNLKLLQPGGAALSETIVKALTLEGVNVKTTYGSTEIGPPFRSIPHTRDNPKCYSFRNLYPDNPLIEMEEVGEGLYECVVHKGFELAAQLWEKSDEPYRTNDLFIQDPPGSGFYVLQGRKDDILVHSNGENTSAGQLQLDVQTSSKLISRALALGHSKPCVGLLVEIHEDYDPRGETIQNKVWESVQEVNPRYPGHSQIMRHMICILPRGKTLPVTPKGNVRRKEAERLYSREIEELFSDGYSSSSSSLSSPPESLIYYLRTVLSSLSNTPPQDIQDWTSFYDLGIDSRLALSLRSSLSSYLHRPISLSTIFENPSISKLITALIPTPTTSPSLSPSSSMSSTKETVGRIISRLEAEFKSWPARQSEIHKLYPSSGKETVLLTGASGSLGTSLIASLSASSKIEKIYAMVRGSNHLSKLQRSFEARGMDSSILAEGGKVEAINFSMQDPLLGLDLAKYSELAEKVTVVVQNAWKMDFNIGVEDFEGDCLRNTMSLLRLCLAARPKRFAFTSSMSTCMGSGHTAPFVSESPIGPDPTVALSTGYAQSKYIVERLTQTAARTLQIPTHLLRVGQLGGSTKTGHWNTSEMWPIMFATSLHPDFELIPKFDDKHVDWIPVDIAANTISNILLASPSIGNEEVNYDVHNIVNPKPIPWSKLVIMLQAQKKGVKEVEMKEWVAKLNILANGGASPDEIPGLRLLQFFEGMVEDGDGESKVFETSKTQEISEALRNCGEFSESWLKGNMRVWKHSGFVKL